jgi:hypothetical protein
LGLLRAQKTQQKSKPTRSFGNPFGGFFGANGGEQTFHKILIIKK